MKPFEVPYKVTASAVCPYTNRIILAHDNILDGYSLKSSENKFTTTLDHQIVSLCTGYQWRHQEAVVFAVTEAGGVAVVSCVDGSCLQHIKQGRVTRVWCGGERVFVVVEGARVMVCEQVDAFIEGDDETDITAYFQQANIKQQQVCDVAVVKVKLWPFDTHKQDYLVTVGSGPSLLMTNVKNINNGGLVSRMASFVLRSTQSNDGSYTESQRRFDRVSVCNDTIMAFDNGSGRVLVFEAQSLLVRHVFKGVRGATMVDDRHIYHPRTNRILSVDGDCTASDCYSIITSNSNNDNGKYIQLTIENDTFITRIACRDE